MMRTYHTRILAACQDKDCERRGAHIKLAGASAPIFKPSAVEAIAAKSSCLPRVINNLTTHALIYGAANGLNARNNARCS